MKLFLRLLNDRTETFLNQELMFIQKITEKIISL